MISMLITVVSAVLILGTIQYLYRHGFWHPDRESHGVLRSWGSLSLLTSLTTAIVGLVRDGSKLLALVAFFLSLFSVLLYVQ